MTTSSTKLSKRESPQILDPEKMWIQCLDHRSAVMWKGAPVKALPFPHSPNIPPALVEVLRLQVNLLTYGLGNFQTVAFVLGLRVSLHVSLSDWNLSSLELWSLDISPNDFQSQMLWGLSLTADPRVEVPDVGAQTLGKSNSFKHEKKKDT